MPATLRIEHPVTDFAVWKGAFDRFADLRQKSGVLQHRVQRPVDDPRYVVIDLDFATTAEADNFRRFLQTKVWSAPENSPALVGTPHTKSLAPAEAQLS
jgi:hypothetical protein